MTRKEIIYSYKNHPWLRRVFGKLGAGDLILIESFLDTNDHLDKGAFEQAALRLFLDNPAKPRRWKEIEELLVCANSAIQDSPRS